jgi:uncharacterized membrane protein YfcA
MFAATLFLVQGGVINLNVFIPMGAGALISVPFSVVAIKKSHENHLKIVIGLLTMLMGGFTIYKSIHI